MTKRAFVEACLRSWALLRGGPSTRQPQVDVEHDDQLKIQFMTLVGEGRNPFAQRTALAGDLRAAITWVGQRSCEEACCCSCFRRGAPMRAALVSRCQVNVERERLMSQIEAAAREMWTTGKVARWFAPADPGIRKVCRPAGVAMDSFCMLVRLLVQVAKGVNGPLLQLLAETIGWHDASAIELFRRGAPLFGDLECSGVGVPEERGECNGDPSQLFNDMAGRNARVRCVGSAVVVCMPSVECSPLPGVEKTQDRSPRE